MLKVKRLGLHGALTLLVMSIGSSAALGAGFREARVQVGDKPEKVMLGDRGEVPESDFSPISCDMGSASTFASALAGYKRVGVWIHSSSSGDCYGYSYARAASTQCVPFLTPEVPVGGPVLVSFSYRIDGNVQLSAAGDDGAAMVSVLARWGPQGGFEHWLYTTDSGGSIPINFGAPYTWQAELTNGDSYSVSMHIEVEAKASCSEAMPNALGPPSDCDGESHSATAIIGADVQGPAMSESELAEFSSSNAYGLKWGGIVGVTDSQGNPITEYTFVDEYGNDWSTPFEENPLGVPHSPVEGAGLTPSLQLTSPNPSSGALTAEFTLVRDGHVRLSLFSIQGQELAVLQEGDYSQGRHKVSWAASRGDGKFPPGVYFLRLKAGMETASLRIVLVQ